MASKARQAFDNNCQDIDRLLSIHVSLAGSGPGRKYQVEVLHKASIVLLTAFWEAYCEDVAAEGLQFLIDYAPDSSSLPKELRKRIAKELSADKDDLAAWRLADAGWRPVLQARLSDLQTERNRRLNTPKTAQIDELFEGALGITNISSSWNWDRTTAAAARAKLDRYIELRGSIAHRGAALTSVRKLDVTNYYDLIKKLVSKTGGRVRREVRKSTGKWLW